MRLTVFTDYSLRVLIHVATKPEGRATIAQIAQAYGISENHVVKVVHRLGQQGLLLNTRGRGGGLELGRPARQINVGEVVRMAEGAGDPADCSGGEGSQPCVIADVCRLGGVLHEALQAFYAVLGRYTLADLVRDRGGLSAILHHYPKVA